MNQLFELIHFYFDRGAADDQQTLIALLRDAQDALGGTLTQDALDAIAQAYGLKPSMLTALIRRIPSLRMADAPHRLEMCQTCRNAQQLRAWVQNQTGDSGFTCRFVPCMKNCKNGPSIRWDATLYSHADKDLLQKLMASAKR